jgi:large subunit ribosomal protein L25
MAEIVLNVEVRERTGTGGARQSRRDASVPGILYGGELAPVPVSAKLNELRKALYTGKLLGHLITLKYGEETQPVIAKAIQFHPVTDVPMHFDLYRVDANRKVKIAIAVAFKNHEASPGLKRGGALNIARHEVELMCPSDSIPEEIMFDLTGLDIGDAVRISAAHLPEGVEPAIHGRDFVIATIAGTSAQASADAAAESAAGPASEG